MGVSLGEGWDRHGLLGQCGAVADHETHGALLVPLGELQARDWTASNDAINCKAYQDQSKSGKNWPISDPWEAWNMFNNLWQKLKWRLLWWSLVFQFFIWFFERSTHLVGISHKLPGCACVGWRFWWSSAWAQWPGLTVRIGNCWESLGTARRTLVNVLGTAWWAITNFISNYVFNSARFQVWDMFFTTITAILKPTHLRRPIFTGGLLFAGLWHGRSQHIGHEQLLRCPGLFGGLVLGHRLLGHRGISVVLEPWKSWGGTRGAWETCNKTCKQLLRL